jgi:hypothetical protein
MEINDPGPGPGPSPPAGESQGSVRPDGDAAVPPPSDCGQILLEGIQGSPAPAGISAGLTGGTEATLRDCVEDAGAG